ncbi:MAG: VOC family protein [Methanobacteriota archaeon]|nr:MAG: VOC family protein [Euryarchaeota archaeon]
MNSFRYLVKDVTRSIAFYTENLGFKVQQDARPAFASVVLGDLRLLLSGPESSGARPMPDGRRPEPGGWNRVVLDVDHLAERVAKLKQAGHRFRNDIISGPGGSRARRNPAPLNPTNLWGAA